MSEPVAIYEQTLLSIVRALPSDRAAELLDFARFLQSLVSVPTPDHESEEIIDADEEEWNALFAKPEAQQAMIQMAHEARADFHAGRATEIDVSSDGRLVPK